MEDSPCKLDRMLEDLGKTKIRHKLLTDFLVITSNVQKDLKVAYNAAQQSLLKLKAVLRAEVRMQTTATFTSSSARKPA